MTTPILRYNDGSKNPPRLRLQYSLWSMIGLPVNAPVEWTLAEKFARVKAAGFEAVECWLTESNEREHKNALEAAGLSLVLGHTPKTLDDVRELAAQAKRLEADYAFCHPLTPYTPFSEAIPFMKEAQRIVNDAGFAYFVETHRNVLPESLLQASQLIKEMPSIRLVGDFSHLVLIGEFYGWEDEHAIERLEPVIRHSVALHGRVSNGEQVQVDVGDGTGDTAQFFVRIWARAMSHWRQGAGPGDVFPFASELGPPRYAITTLDGREISDRWEQSLVMKQLAEQAWEMSALV